MTIFSLDDENRVLQGQLCRGHQRISSLGRENPESKLIYVFVLIFKPMDAAEPSIWKPFSTYQFPDRWYSCVHRQLIDKNNFNQAYMSRSKKKSLF